MSGLPRDPIPELTTTRTGGGRSARLIALAIAVVLVALVYVGVTGRALPPQDARPTSDIAFGPGPTAPSATETPPASATPSASEPSPDAEAARYPGASEILDDPPRPWPFTWVAVALRIGGTLSLADLYDDEPGHLRTDFHVPLPVPTQTATLELFEVGRAYESETYGTWELPMDVFDPNTPPNVNMVDEVRSPNRFLSSPPIVANGYRIVVFGERQADAGIIHVDITVGSNPTYPDGIYTVVAGAGQWGIEVPVNEDSVGRLSGRIVFPNSVHSRDVALLLRGSELRGFLNGEHLASLVVSLPPKKLFVPGASAFSAIFDPDPLAPNRMGIVNQGFQFDGTYELVNGRRALSFRLRINPIYEDLLHAPDGPLALIEHNWVTGDDGLVGWPTSLSTIR